MAIGLIVALVISFIIAALLFGALRRLDALVVNGIIGIIVFWLLAALGLISIPINILTVLIAAIGGLPGVIVVIVLNAVGVVL